MGPKGSHNGDTRNNARISYKVQLTVIVNRNGDGVRMLPHEVDERGVYLVWKLRKGLNRKKGLNDSNKNQMTPISVQTSLINITR